MENGANESRKVRVAVVDRLPIVRAGVANALKPTADLVAEGASTNDAFTIGMQQAIDIMLVDAFALQGGGAQFISAFKRKWPAIRVVVFTSQDSDTAVAGALQSGAQGFISKDAACHELRSAIAAVAAGEVYVSPTLGARLLTSSYGAHRNAALQARVPMQRGDLTPREMQILAEVSIGATNREIAQALRITEKTVKHYMTSIMQKLGVRNRVEAVVAIRDRTRASA